MCWALHELRKVLKTQMQPFNKKIKNTGRRRPATPKRMTASNQLHSEPRLLRKITIYVTMWHTCHQNCKLHVTKCNTCHAKSAATNRAQACRQFQTTEVTSVLACNVTEGTWRSRARDQFSTSAACHHKWRSMSPSATPVGRNRRQPVQTQCHECQACQAKTRKVQIHVTMFHACHAQCFVFEWFVCKLCVCKWCVCEWSVFERFWMICVLFVSVRGVCVCVCECVACAWCVCKLFVCGSCVCCVWVISVWVLCVQGIAMNEEYCDWLCFRANCG